MTDNITSRGVKRDFNFDNLRLSESLTCPSIDINNSTSIRPILPAGNLGTTKQTLPPLLPVRNLVYSDGKNWIPLSTQSGSAVEPIFETNDLLQTTPNLANIIQVYGDDTQSAPPFTQRRSGLLTTVSAPNRITVQNQRDITSYVVGDQTIYNTQFATIQEAVDQAVLDGVDSTASPKREVFIIIRPGVYPDPVTIPQHGIHLIGMTSGQTKDVEISGSLTFALLDTPGKTFVLVRGLYITGSVTVTTPINFNPKISFEHCIIGMLTLMPTISTTDITFLRTEIQGSLNCSGTVVNLVLLDNCNVQTINIDQLTQFTLNANTSFFNVYQINDITNVIDITANLCFFGINLFVPGITSYINQTVALRIQNCQLGGCIVYGSIVPQSIITNSNIAVFELGDPNPGNTDANYVYSLISNSGPPPPIAVITPFLISHCIFTGFLSITMKSNIADNPQTIIISHCVFNTLSNDQIHPALKIIDLSDTVQITSPQTVIISHCVLSGPVGVNFDSAGVIIPSTVGANLFINFEKNQITITNVSFPPSASPFACIIGGSTGAVPPVTVTIIGNGFTLNNILTDFVINGIVNGFTLTYLDGTGNLFGNSITNPGATLAGNLLTGAVGVLNNGLAF